MPSQYILTLMEFLVNNLTYLSLNSEIMKDQDIMKATKIKVAETIIFPTVTYGSESWMVRKKVWKKLMPLSYKCGEEFYKYRRHRGERTY
jgi:hypothetical protein